MKRPLLLLLCLLSVHLIMAQEEDTLQPKKPKIGVVLSGGGAKGLAHIGALKVLEEAGVEISYIGGTSMGAIIGGLYASGYSAKQLDSIFQNVDSDALLRDFTPRGSKNFFEKRNDEIYALTLPFKNFKLGFPTAVSKGLYNYAIINRLTNHVRHIRDFDNLPIPFVCIATDIETGKEVVLHHGVLPDAILASGAFPSLYYPVEIDGRLLIDGGVTNNYPVEEVKKMGADIIIGIDVQDGLKSRDEIKGATGILVQINNYQMIEKMVKKRKETDVYIKPDISGYSVISFDQGREIIDEGEKAAIKMWDTIRKYGSGRPIVRENPKTEDTLNIEYIKVNSLKYYNKSYVVGKLRIKAGSKVTYKKLDEGISSLNATQNFNAISYCFDKGADGADVLNMHLEENPINRYLKFGLHYDGLYKSAVLVNLTQKKLLFQNDVASLDVILGDHFRYNFDYYLDNGFHISYGFHSRYSNFNRNISAEYNEGEFLRAFGVNALNLDFTDFTNRAYLQTIFTQKFLIGGGAELKHLKIQSETVNSADHIFDDSDYFSLYGYLKYDSYNNKYFPKKGWYFSGEAKTFLFSSDYNEIFGRFSIFKADMGIVKEVLPKLSIELRTEGGFTVTSDATVPFFEFILGGYGYYMTNNFRHFFGYDFLSLSGDSYIKGTATVDYEIFRKNHINFTANYANIGQRIYDEGNIFSVPQYSGYAFGYGMETIIGPIEIKHSWSPDTRNHYTWFSVGFWF
ncbi:patatin-like phospholipase family protein [Flavobacterium beibuense]|nr:patatin-like phospholipase family protein [Flavobacterium beibuense]